MSWIINSDYFTPLFDLRGKIEGLEGLDRKVMGFDFDRFVKDNVESNPPSSTDSILSYKDWLLFIEFKGGDDPPKDGSDEDHKKSKSCGLKLKASDSVFIFDHFISMNWPNVPPKRCLIIVTSGGYNTIRSAVGNMANRKCYCPDFLNKYQSKDVCEKRIFYDRVCWLSSKEFVRCINSRFPELLLINSQHM